VSGSMRTIEVFADIVCPFTHVGLQRLAAERSARGRDDVVLLVRAWPLELINGEPVARESAARQVVALRDSVAPDLFAGFDETLFPLSSLPALLLAAAAYHVALPVGEGMSLDLRRALFEEGRDVSDPTVLAELAGRHGVPFALHDEFRERVVADLEEGEGRGVRGSPHFFVDGTDVFCPTLQIAKVDGQLTVSVDVERFGEFMERCFG